MIKPNKPVKQIFFRKSDLRAILEHVAPSSDTRKTITVKATVKINDKPKLEKEKHDFTIYDSSEGPYLRDDNGDYIPMHPKAPSSDTNELKGTNCRKHQDAQVYGEYGQRGCMDCVYVKQLIATKEREAYKKGRDDFALELTKPIDDEPHTLKGDSSEWYKRARHL